METDAVIKFQIAQVVHICVLPFSNTVLKGGDGINQRSTGALELLPNFIDLELGLEIFVLWHLRGSLRSFPFLMAAVFNGLLLSIRAASRMINADGEIAERMSSKASSRVASGPNFLVIRASTGNMMALK